MFCRTCVVGGRRPTRFLAVQGALVLAIAAGTGTALHRPLAAQKYDPQDPTVQALITKAMGYLMQDPSPQIGPAVMLGMAAYKSNIVLAADKPKDHELITAAVDAIYAQCSQTGLRNSMEFDRMYASALACVFLLELDPVQHRNQIQILLDHIAERQQASGAWGYRTHPNVGDTSQMQYICLALWLAAQNGFRLNPVMGERALDWIARTQDNGGGWIYQQPPGQIAGEPDNEVRHSLVAAGLGSAYLLADWLKLVNRSTQSAAVIQARRTAEISLPSFVRDITDNPDAQQGQRQQGALVSFDRGRLRSTLTQGNTWFRQNFRPDPNKYTMYYLYGFERYASLREYVDDEMQGIENWYDRGVEYLMRSQANNGSWSDSSTDIGLNIKTAFGVLFLTRSMAITIGEGASGIVRGDQGFTSDTQLTVVNDQIISLGVTRNVEDFLALMEDPDDEEIARFVASLDQLILSDDSSSRSQQLATLRMLVKNENADMRLAAVKFLALQRNLDNAPALIYSITDPDERIAHAANNGLKFVSRKTSGFNLSQRPNSTEADALQERWKAWYLHVQPGAELFEDPDR